MAISAEQYQKGANESVDQYNSRIAGLRGEGGTPTSKGGSGSTGSSSGTLMDTIQERLLNQSDLISSSSTGLQKNIEAAIKGVSSATKSSNAAIESAYGREKAFAEDQASLGIQGALEERSGFATSMVAFRNLVDTTDKNLKDLDQRKNELILQNDAQGASKIADLQLQSLQFKQEAQQQVFSNLLSMGGFAMQQKQLGLQERAQTFEESAALGNIALQYGVALEDGDTIDTVVAKAAPFASEKQRLELAQIRSQINQNNASIAKAYADIEGNKPLDAVSLEALARSYQKNPDAVLGVVKNTDMLSQILKSVAQVTMTDLKGTVEQNAATGASTAADDIRAVTSNPNLSPSEKAAAIEYIGSQSYATQADTSFNLGAFITGKKVDDRGSKFTEINKEIARLKKINTYASNQKIKELERQRASI